MKLVFLDFDGVLNTTTDPDTSNLDPDEYLYGSVRWGAAQFSKKRVGHLNEILVRTDSLVVLSTSWREVHPQRELVEMLELNAFYGSVIGCTPTLRSGQLGRKVHRHDEIAEYVRLVSPEAYVILDDMDMGPLNNHLVKTNGLSKVHIEKAVRILNG